MDIKKPQLVKVVAFAIFLRGSSATPSSLEIEFYAKIGMEIRFCSAI
ncbi:MAG: hypothetical protein HDS99_05140 [Bacteroidales bacterium]|nr:hypothetical protein [Bacteroidales bacterium]